MARENALIGFVTLFGEFILHFLELARGCLEKEFGKGFLDTGIDGGLKFLPHLVADFFLDGGNVGLGGTRFGGGLVVFLETFNVALVLRIRLAGDLGKGMTNTGCDQVGFLVRTTFLEQILEFMGNLVVEDKGKLAAKPWMG